MAVLRWKRASSPDANGVMDAYNTLERFQEELDRWWGWDGYAETSGLLDRSRYPLLDLVETPEGCTIWADLPGIDKKDLDLSVTANVLTLKGEKPLTEDKGKDKGRVFRDETWSGTFQRSITLPDTIDTSRVTAELRDGVLTVTFARRPEHKPRQIAVRTN